MKNKGRIGIAEPMCITDTAPKDITCFDTCSNYKEWLRTVQWNSDLFSENELKIIKTNYFNNGYQIWIDHFKYYDGEKG